MAPRCSNDPQSGSDEWGHASSPILYGDLVLVQGDRRKDSLLDAYRLATGEEVWRTPREELSTWATPRRADGSRRPPCRCSRPAISGGLLIVRTLNHIYGLAEPVAASKERTGSGGR